MDGVRPTEKKEKEDLLACRGTKSDRYFFANDPQSGCLYFFTPLQCMARRPREGMCLFLRRLLKFFRVWGLRYEGRASGRNFLGIGGRRRRRRIVWSIGLSGEGVRSLSPLPLQHHEEGHFLRSSSNQP